MYLLYIPEWNSVIKAHDPSFLNLSAFVEIFYWMRYDEEEPEGRKQCDGGHDPQYKSNNPHTCGGKQ